MRAYVFIGPVTLTKKFFVSEKSATTTSAALTDPLKITEQLIEGHIEDTTKVNAKRTKAALRTNSSTSSASEHVRTTAGLAAGQKELDGRSLGDLLGLPDGWKGY